MPPRSPSPAFPRLAAALVLLLPLVFGGGQRQGDAQVAPTPTPTATPTPTPAIAFAIPATTRYSTIPNGGRYDGANVLLDPDGAVWAASASDNSVVQVSADGTTFRRWTFPTGSSPSSFLRNDDGTFWVTELGGFNAALFDPQKGTITRWPDSARRPTAFVKRPDGRLWLPETGGALALFDPAASTFTYFSTAQAVSLSYPLMDPDGTVWTCDFIVPAIIRFSADGSSGTRYAIPTLGSQPSRLIRGPDGALWITLYGAGLVARFDPSTLEWKTWNVGTGTYPYSIVPYRGQFLFSEQGSGYIGLFDPATRPVAESVTLEKTDFTTTRTEYATAPTTTDLTADSGDVASRTVQPTDGTAIPGLSLLPAGIGIVWGLAVDETRGRIAFGTTGSVGYLGPPLAASSDYNLIRSAASTAGAAGSFWKTKVNVLNRGVSPQGSPAPDLDVSVRLLPTGWIAGFAPGTGVRISPGKMAVLPDPIGTEMSVQAGGALRMTASPDPSQIVSWARTYVAREDGGTYGIAWNGRRSTSGVAAGELGFSFAPPSTTGVRTNAGYLVTESARGSISAVAADGTPLASRAFDFPSGYQWQGSTIFAALGIPPAPSARIVWSVDSGSVLPFAMSIDETTNDPLLLETVKPGAAVALQWLLGVARGSGPAGPTATTDLQLYNPSKDPSSVTLLFRAAIPAASPGPAPPPAIVLITVPAGQVLTLQDVLQGTFGISSGIGEITVLSTPAVNAFCRVTSAMTPGSAVGYGVAAINGGDGVGPKAPGVFLGVADAGWDVTRSDLYLTNPLDVPQTARISATTEEGVAAGAMDVTLAPKETRFVEGIWYAIAGFGTTDGRLDLTVPSGDGPILSTLLRSDRKTLDVDAVPPVVIPVTP